MGIVMVKFNVLNGMCENENIEAKRSEGGLPESIWETYSAFANTGGGIILLGVGENTDKSLKICGLKNAQALIAEFRSSVRNPSIVSADILSENDVYVQQEKDREIVVIHVPKAPRRVMPVYIGGSIFSGSYRREGEADMHLCRQEVYEMLRRKWGKERIF